MEEDFTGPVAVTSMLLEVVAADKSRQVESMVLAHQVLASTRQAAEAAVLPFASRTFAISVLQKMGLVQADYI